MKYLKYILFLLLIVVIGLAIYIAVQPNSFEVTRSKTINAPQAVVYNEVIDLKNWEDWSSWKEADPSITISYPGKTEGVGGTYTWEDEDGVGVMTTLEANPNASISQEMQFAEFPKSDVNWTFEPNDDGSTEVTWTISGKDLPFQFKMFSTLMGGMEKQIGPHYERSLTMLDSVVTNDMKTYSIDVKGVTQHSGGYYLYNTASSKISDYPAKMQEMFPKVGAYALANNITFAGAPFVLIEKWDEENDAVIFSSCIPTQNKIISNEADILTGQLEPLPMVLTELKGDYSNLPEAWEKAMAFFETSSYELDPNGPMLEVYPTDPSQVPNPKNWLTQIYLPIKE
ncbi:SRPBCC family protein [Winogradskyella maritima]|uniref:SRPBCC family protein n=1 Tax=Winogradskyella maritima TaxID=1517766 RepID=A0ABV8AND9_9FLAO|nr:SRPBCC family protein [Winogradskyella maritima]